MLDPRGLFPNLIGRARANGMGLLGDRYKFSSKQRTGV